MTTLPQTTPLRLPTVATGAMAPAPVPMGGAFTPAGPQLTFSDVMRVIRSNLLMIIILVGLAAVAGFFINRELAKRWPKYTARGLVEIESKILIDPLNTRFEEISDTRLSIEQRKHAELLKQDFLFSAALRNPQGKMASTDWYKEFRLPDGKPDISAMKEDLRKNLGVSAIPETGLVSISFEHKRPADCKVIVEEIVRIHLEQQRTIAENQFNQQTRQLTEMKGRFDQQVTELSSRTQGQVESLARQGLPVGRSSFSSLEVKHQILLKDMLDTKKEMEEVASTYQNFKNAIEKGESISMVDRAVDADFMLSGYIRDLSSFELNRDMLLLGGGPESPQVIRANKTIELIAKKIEDRRQELRIKYRDELVNRARGEFESKAGLVKAKTEALDALEKTMSTLRGEEARLLRDIDREKELREMQMQIDNKIRDLASVTDPASRASVKWAPNGQPTEPEIPSFPKLTMTMSVSIMAGLFLALGIAFLRELMDDTVRTPRDITRVGQLNLLGIIADESDDPMVADTRLPIFDAPQSLTAEQFRQVRTRMAHASPLDTTRTIMVTGPSPLDGKTTVAANLAAGLALNGRKILLVDSNFRRPEVHRLFGVANDRGFADVLNGTATFDDVVAASRIPNLFVMPSGPKPMNATELFESQLLIDFIDRALEDYDHVIFDSGPFLIVSEAVALAPRVDGVITVVRAHSESRGLLHRMRDSLRQVKAEHIGVVLNAVRAQGGGYYRRQIKQFYNYQSEA